MTVSQYDEFGLPGPDVGVAEAELTLPPMLAVPVSTRKYGV